MFGGNGAWKAGKGTQTDLGQQSTGRGKAGQVATRHTKNKWGFGNKAITPTAWHWGQLSVGPGNWGWALGSNQMGIKVSQGRLGWHNGLGMGPSLWDHHCWAGHCPTGLGNNSLGPGTSPQRLFPAWPALGSLAHPPGLSMGDHKCKGSVPSLGLPVCWPIIIPGGAGKGVSQAWAGWLGWGFWECSPSHNNWGHLKVHCWCRQVFLGWAWAGLGREWGHWGHWGGAGLGDNGVSISQLGQQCHLPPPPLIHSFCNKFCSQIHNANVSKPIRFSIQGQSQGLFKVFN